MRTSALIGSALATLASTPAMAQVASGTTPPIVVAGSRENVNPVTPPGGRCVPPLSNTVNIAPGAVSSTGTSNLGTFTSTQSHCIVSSPPTPLIDGRFEYRFEGGDSIFGTYSGNTTISTTAGVFDAVENLTITGGTGRFIGASGTITDTGTLRFGAGPTGIFMGQLSGSLAATTTTASGAYTTALGSPSAATGDYATAVGAFSLAGGARSLAAGSFAEAPAAGAVAVGDDTSASGASAIALGQQARATGDLSLAAGFQAQASNVRTTAVGTQANASGLNATAVGNFAAAAGMGASAFGNGASAAGIGATASGVRSTASGDFSTAVGRLTTASGTGSIALGNSAVTGAAGAIAIGSVASANFANATALGAGASATAAGQVALGGAGSQVRVGDIATSTLAQDPASVGVATVDANGVLGRSATLLPNVAALQTASAAQLGRIGALEAAGAALGSRVDALFDLRKLDRRDTRRGIAAAVAIGQASMPSEPGRTSFVFNGASFRGENAVGGSFLHRFNGDTALAVGGGFSIAGSKNTAVRVGVAGEF